MYRSLKNILSVFIVLLVTASYMTAFAAPTSEKLPVPELNAQSAILLDMKTGKVIYSKDPDAKMYPASTTKILTGIIALEKCEDLSEVVTATHAAIDPITREDSHMGILIGENLTIEQLINGMLIYSANDAANVLAVHISGSIDEFAKLMNEKAQELGMNNSHFANPHGFHTDEHYTTARDLSAAARYAMQNEKFREIVKTPRYIIPATNKYTTDRILTSTNHLISKYRNASYFYPYAIGIKTGFTNPAGNCLVAAAEKDGTQLLSVVMKCTNTAGTGSFVDTRALFDYGFSNFKYIDIAQPGEVVSDSAVYEAKDNTRVAISVRENVSALLPSDIDIKQDITPDIKLNETIQAPILKGDVLGDVTYTYNGEQIGGTQLVAVNDVERDVPIWVVHTAVNVVKNPLFLGAAAIAAIGGIYLKLKPKKNSYRSRRRY